MKILFLGHKGYLGNYLAKFLYQEHDIDFVDTRKLDRKPTTKYDAIINCAGLASVEKCEHNILDAYLANVQPLEWLLSLSDTKLIHFSSYYVYKDSWTCSEESNTHGGCVYTSQKLYSERLALLNPNSVVFRLGKLYGDQYLKSLRLTERIISAPNDSVFYANHLPFNPTYLGTVAEAVKEELKSPRLKGIYNLADEGFTDSIKYARFISGYLEKNLTIRSGYTAPDYNIYTPDACLMSINKYLKSGSAFKPSYWTINMEAYLKKMKL
jgi:dTDP-4-dehydrorhamnose reductase